MSMFKKSFIVSTITLIIATLFFVFCGDEGTPDYCSDGHPYNSHTHFCWNDGQAYPICEGISNYDPTEKFCDDDKLYPRCNGNTYLTSVQFCAPGDILLYRCSGEEFDPELEGCVHNQEVWPRCGRNFFDDEIEFCHNGNMVFKKCAGAPNFDYSTFNPQTGCDGITPEWPTCGGLEYDPNILFCYYNDSEDDFGTTALCGGVDFDANTHDCINNEIVLKNQTNTNAYSVTIESDGTGATGGGSYSVNTAVTIFAGTPPENHVFVNWTTTSANVTIVPANSPTAMFAMPASDVTVTANFEITTTPPPIIPPLTAYSVTVSSVGTGASGDGNYAEGVRVTIYAGIAPTRHRFVNWTAENADVTFADQSNVTTTFTMPANDVTVLANFDEIFDCDTYNPETHFCDERDNKAYRFVAIGSRVWMAENLSYNATGSWCNGNDADNCNGYGRHYNLTAMP